MAGPPPYDTARPLLVMLPGLGVALVVAVIGWRVCRAIWGKKPKRSSDAEPTA